MSALKFCAHCLCSHRSGFDRPRFENQHGYHLYRFLPHGAVSTKWVINKTFDPHTNMALAWIKQQIIPEGEVTFRCLFERAWGDHTLRVKQGAVLQGHYVDSRECVDSREMVGQEDDKPGLWERLRKIAEGRSHMQHLASGPSREPSQDWTTTAAVSDRAACPRLILRWGRERQGWVRPLTPLQLAGRRLALGYSYLDCAADSPLGWLVDDLVELIGAELERLLFTDGERERTLSLPKDSLCLLFTPVLRAGGPFEPSWWWSQDDRLLTYAWSRTLGDLESTTKVQNQHRTTRLAGVRDGKLVPDECERRRRHLGLPDRDELVERHAQVS